MALIDEADARHPRAVEHALASQARLHNRHVLFLRGSFDAWSALVKELDARPILIVRDAGARL